MSTQQVPESGLRYDRIGWLREAVTGQVPDNPNWQYHSDDYIDVTWSPDPGASRRDGLGTPDPTGHDVGAESHEVTVSYRLQQAVVDGNGDPLDASGDAWLRDADNNIPNTHAFLAREERETASVDDPADVLGARTYTVGKGGYPDASFEGDPEEGEPVPSEITYTFEKVRSYHILQPDAAVLIAFRTSDANDTTQTITIEGVDDTGTFTSESVALNGTTLVSTSTAFDSIDAVELDTETLGDVEVLINDGTTTSPAAGTLLCDDIKGSLYYSEDGQPLEGDLGVPALGTGSHPTAIGTAFEHFHGDSVQRAAEDIAYDLNNFTAEVDNNYDPTPRTDSVRYRINTGNRAITHTADVIGEKASHKYIIQSLIAQGDDVVWTMSNTEFTFETSSVTDPPERTRESEQAAAGISVGFEARGLSIAQV